MGFEGGWARGAGQTGGAEMTMMHGDIRRNKIEPPELYAMNLLMLHLRFGLLVGVIYGAAVG